MTDANFTATLQTAKHNDSRKVGWIIPSDFFVSFKIALFNHRSTSPVLSADPCENLASHGVVAENPIRPGIDSNGILNTLR